tara:strand:+ start:263 stop:958 length:696 start_codon:yes stop_codon:yes gene_type:complete
MTNSPYQILGVKRNATYQEIKSAYRELVKRYHPDAGGGPEVIIAINAAWEILGDEAKKKAFDLSEKNNESIIEGRDVVNMNADNRNNFENSIKNIVIDEEHDLAKWLKIIYTPIDKSIGQIINSFPSKIRALSADPYDDTLMEDFCFYINQSKSKIKKIHQLYQSKITPTNAQKLALNLYHCFSQVEDALNEFELYTKGYVDDYLHDGNEMIREAKRKRKQLKESRRKLPL